MICKRGFFRNQRRRQLSPISLLIGQNGCGQDELHIRVEAVTPDYLSKSPLFSKQIFSRTLFPVSDFSAQDNNKTNDESRQ
jgi:hypothetical protein